MKKNILIILVCFICSSIFAEEITFRTGDAFALSITDYFCPDDINLMGSKCSITSIKKVEKDMWCISVSALRQGSVTVPITFDYYVKEGDTIKFQRINNQMNKCTLKVLFIQWNKVVFAVQSDD